MTPLTTLSEPELKRRLRIVNKKIANSGAILADAKAYKKQLAEALKAKKK